MNLLGLDCETFLIGPGAVAPKLVCTTLATVEPRKGKLLGNGDASLVPTLKKVWSNPDITIVGHALSYDASVIHESIDDQELRDAVWDAYKAGRCQDTKIREKLLNLSETGVIDMMSLPDGSMSKVSYHLADLVKSYLGKDRSADKEGEDVWRLHYNLLDGLPASEYPDDAASYAIEDAEDAADVFLAQEKRVRSDHGPSSLRTAQFHTAVDFALRMMTVRGMQVDPESVIALKEHIESEISDEKMKPLIDGQILRASEPERPYASGAKNEDGTPKMKKAVPSSVNTKQLKDLVQLVALAKGYELRRTDTGEISTDAATIEDLAPHNPLLALYQHRQSYIKLATSFLPTLEQALANGGTIHPDYDVLKETGRTSSYGSKLYPSFNIQQQPKQVRPCFRARDGYYLCSIDYSAIELVSLAQKCFSLFGQSKLRDLINEGGDPHAYLGAQLALHFHEEFKLLCEREGMIHDKDAVYETFKRCKKSKSEEVRKFYGHYRTFAKPTGLGYPGGLGAETFVSYAKATYGIVVTIEEAELMKKVWFETFPEMKLYFAWIDQQRDPENLDSFSYVTPFGMYRAGATFCAAANGVGLQSPTSEGAKLAVFDTSYECYHSKGSLRGAFPVAFIHDEIIFELPCGTAHELAFRAAEVMVASMGVVMTDVKVKAEPALMIVWDKRAEATYDAEGRLVPWTPTE